MVDLRRQLQEAGKERTTLMNVQRKNRADIMEITEAKEQAEREAQSLQRELTLRKMELKASATSSDPDQRSIPEI